MNGFLFCLGDCLARACLVSYLLQLETSVTCNLCKFTPPLQCCLSIRIFFGCLFILFLLFTLFFWNLNVIWSCSAKVLSKYDCFTFVGCFKIMASQVQFPLKLGIWRSFRHLISPIIFSLVRYQILWATWRTWIICKFQNHHITSSKLSEIENTCNSYTRNCSYCLHLSSCYYLSKTGG